MSCIKGSLSRVSRNSSPIIFTSNESPGFAPGKTTRFLASVVTVIGGLSHGPLLFATVKALRTAGFVARTFPWSVNLKGRSAVSVQISTEEVYREFPARSVPADIHGILMRVASLPDTLRGKILAWQDPERRASKRQKDLLDIMRLVEAHPKLRKLLPADLAKRIERMKRP